MDIQTRIARDRRADRIHELYKRCHARFIQAAYAFRLANDRIETMAFEHPARAALASVLDRATRQMATLSARSTALARAYVATIVPEGERHA